MVVVQVKLEMKCLFLLQEIIRNVTALSDAEPILEELFQYRFEEHQIEGHSLGNLLLAALTNIK